MEVVYNFFPLRQAGRRGVGWGLEVGEGLWFRPLGSR